MIGTITPEGSKAASTKQRVLLKITPVFDAHGRRNDICIKRPRTFSFYSSSANVALCHWSGHPRHRFLEKDLSLFIDAAKHGKVETLYLNCI